MGTSHEVSLQEFLPEHTRALLSWTSGSAELEQLWWAGPAFTYPLDERQVNEYLKRLDAHTRLYLITYGQEPCGIIELGRIDPVNRNARIGKVLIGRREVRGRSIASRALAQLCSYAFEELGLHCLTLGVFEQNLAAYSCYVKAGFTKDWVRKEYRRLSGRWYDLIEMSLYRDRWQEHEPCHPLNSLSTERLHLRSPMVGDAPAICEYYLKNSAFLSQFGPERPEHFTTETFQHSLLLEDIQRERRRDGMRLWISLKEDPGRFIGSVSFSCVVGGNFRSCFTGYMLDSEYTRRGYMTEALAAATGLAFDYLDLHRIEANIMPGNTASVKTAMKVGFHYEGTAKDYLCLDGSWQDHSHYTLLRPD